MINITVYSTKDVIGDKGKIIGYEGQLKSEPIQITHPAYPSAEYYIEYKYNQTIYRDKLDSSDKVVIQTLEPGYVKCHFVACDIRTGNVIFKSYPWNLIVAKETNVEPNHYPCYNDVGYQKYRNPYNHYDCGCNHSNNASNNDCSYKAYAELYNLLNEEVEIRNSAIKSLYEELQLLKAELNIQDEIYRVLDADLLVLPGKYWANESSIHFPHENEKYKLEVSTNSITSEIMQTAYEIDSDNIWYRTGSMTDENTASFTKWSPQITRVTEI